MGRLASYREICWDVSRARDLATVKKRKHKPGEGDQCKGFA